MTGEMSESESSTDALKCLEREVFRPEHGWGFIENPAPGPLRRLSRRGRSELAVLSMQAEELKNKYGSSGS